MIQRRRLAQPLAALAAGVLALTACTGQGSGSSGTGFVEGAGTITRVPKDERLPVPELTGESTEGERLSLADYEGQVVVLNVWGSWCGPCRAEAPNLKKVAEETADRGVQFIGINTRDLKRQMAVNFDEEFGIDYPSFFDPKGKLMLEFPSGTLSPQGIPSTLIIDRDGGIAVRLLKPLTEEELRDALDPVIAEQG